MFACDSTEACNEMRSELAENLPAPHIEARNSLLVIENISGLRLNGFIDTKGSETLAFKRVN